MNRLMVVLLACFCVAIVGDSSDSASAIAADKKKKKDTLVGKWEVVKSEEGLPAGTLFEFKADGSLTVTLELNGKSATLEATYKHEGKMITHTEKSATAKPEVETIKTLTADKLVTANKDGKETEFKKK